MVPISSGEDPVTDRTYNVLFLCTGNSARSIMAEAILGKEGAGRFRPFSAGSRPKGAVNPLAIKTLLELEYRVDGLRSKGWEEFSATDAPVMDFVFTVCDDAAGEPCPVWPGQPISAHWGIEDPAAVVGSEIQREAAFFQAARFLKNRITAFCNLPMAGLDELTLTRQVGEIGRLEGTTWRRPDVA